jgi:hypothetical protein
MRAFVTCLVLAACSRTETIRSEPPPRAREQQSELPKLAQVPKDFSELGMPCDRALADCGTDGRKARVWVNSYKMFGLPQGILAFSWVADARANVAVGALTLESVGFERDTVWLQSTCQTCRMATNVTEVVAVRAAAEPVLVALQTSLGLPASPLLRTPEAFKQAVAARLKRQG